MNSDIVTERFQRTKRLKEIGFVELVELVKNGYGTMIEATSLSVSPCAFFFSLLFPF